ncbi:RDD family protein [Nocardiopsis sp. HUAS JQ3]|uniref:RDD family protein n=1 Tax=Nocardiopsis sp. HUAS JQ3 TaxID=3061629 RepID=UPI0023A9465E|nr:RDD family protein [Nocardiopsis sp. HUAS JQ3]WDZ90753.1 RDD family protein [Nocardiopsis sp. HUAS JQ3]
MQPPHQPAGGQPEHGSPYAGYDVQPAYQAPYAPSGGQAPAHPAPSGYQTPPVPAYATPPQAPMYPPPHQTPYAYGHQGYYPPPQSWLPPALTDPGHWSPHNPEIGRAEMGVRFLARMVDTIVFGFLWFAMMLLGTFVSAALGGGEIDGGPGETTFMVVYIFNFFLLPIVLEWLQVRLWGRSVGKMLLGLWVVRSDGSGRVRAGRAFVRALLYAPGHTNLVNWLLPWSITNVLWPLRDKRTRKCLHDKAAGTVVVQVRR